MENVSLRLALDGIRAEERERCAKLVETLRAVKHYAQGKYEVETVPTREEFAAAIRNLKSE